MPLPLPPRLLNLGAVALTVLVVDWSLKAWAQIDLPPAEIVSTPTGSGRHPGLHPAGRSA